MQVGGVLLLLSSLLSGHSSAQPTPEANLTVAGDALRSDLYRMDRPPPTVDACRSGGSVNWAFKMPVAMSSTVSGSPGAQATDGDVTKCAATKSSSNPWLRIDLGTTRRVGKLFLRLPNSAALNGLQVYIGENTANGGTTNALCATVAAATKPWTVITCSVGTNGRFVFLRLPGTSKTINVCEVAAFANCPSATYCPNVALGRPAYHSSQCSGGSPNRAVDGGLATTYTANSCTHTCTQSNPWWFVDLQQWRVVSKVLVTNRGDCCWGRLNGLEVWVGINKSPPGTASPNVKCTAPATVGKGATVTVNCPANAVGQYVYVRLPGNSKVLTLCEVQVFETCPSNQVQCTDPGCKRGKEANVALGRPTRQSTNYNSVYLSKNAVDGRFSGDIKFCTHTETQTDPWWWVDLGCERTVAKVTVSNRGDCCGDRLNGFKIAVGNDVSVNGGTGNTPCGGGYTVGQGLTLMVECPRLKGRYVTVFLKGTGKVLQLCEVQVFEPCDETCYNLALGQPATYSNGDYPSGATDGNRNTNYWGRSCYLSYTTTNPYFTVDLGHVRKVGKIRLWNRGDCASCTNGLDNFEVRLGWSSNGNNNQLCYFGSARFYVEKHQSVDVVCDANRLGQYVTVKEYGSRRLGICEIEVYETGNCYDYGCYNLAKGRGASISSLYSLTKYQASKAVDGNYWSKSLTAGSCTHSNTQANPWFRVDLLQEMIVTKVYLANRGDCCGNKMTNFMIRVGSSAANAGNNNPICRQKLPTLGNGAYVAYACPSMMGRYVNLQIIQSSGTLNFCELQVCGSLAPNSALGRPTTQSSTGSGGVSLRAVDGDPNTRYNSGSCTHTNTEKNPWWRVDLQQELIVTSLRVTNRGDCCGTRLYGMEIRVGSSLDFEGNNNQKCTTNPLNIPQGKTFTIMCNDGAGLKGRYVNILVSGDNKVITLCEVMVFTKKDRQCQLSGLTKEGCGQPCPAKTGGIGCHQCPAGQTGRLRHVDSGLCVVPNNKTFPVNDDLLVMTNKCDGIESLFLYSPSNLLYHVASGACVQVLNGGFTPIEGQPLVFYYGCDPTLNRLQYTIDDDHFKNVRTKQCIRVKSHNPSPGDTLNLYKDCTHGAVDYEFIIDPGNTKKWSMALNVQTDDARFGYFSDNWVNPTYFGDPSNRSANAWLPAYDGVLVEKIGIQINGIDRVVELSDNIKGKWTLRDLVLRDGSISYLPAVKRQLDPFNFQVSTPPVSYCTNIGTNQQILDSQQWPGCHSMARIGVPMANPIRTGVFKLQMGTRCIHISGGGFGTPVDNKELVAWTSCNEDRLRFTYQTDGSFLHSSGAKCLGLRNSPPAKGTRVVIKPCSSSAKFTWRSDGVIVLKSNNKLCWGIEGNSATPTNGKRIQLSDGCDPKVNPMFQFRMYEGILDTPCGKPLAVEGVGLYYGCGHVAGSAGRLLWGNLMFKPSAVWVYGKPSCNPLTSSGCNSQVGYCACKDGYFGAACEYRCPKGRFGRNCRSICQCKNGAICSNTDGSCTCPVGYRGTLCADLCAPGYYGVGCQKCNCSATAAGCDVFTGQCTCPSGYGGAKCDQQCGSGAYTKMWGPNCANKCTCVNGTCDRKTGKCTCYSGYTGSDCKNPCPSHQYGLNCVQTCYCRYQSSCDHVTGKCNCVAGYTGKDCGTACDSNHCGSDCNQLCQCSQGTCDRFTCSCQCYDGYTGDKCEKICPTGMYGKNCSQQCLCHTQVSCDHVSGACTCTAGLSGRYCNITCPQGKYGVNCIPTCSCAHGSCDSVDGTCVCDPGWKGSKCDTSCPAGTFGLDCVEHCKCSSSVTPDVCDNTNGKCLCQTGFYGVKCDSPCSGRKWGPNCELDCTCQNSGSCDPNDGSCECPAGYIGSLCNATCATGKFGINCQYPCTCSPSSSVCNPLDGTCLCHSGYRGHDCDDVCASGTWGLGCKQMCTCVNGICDPKTGLCQCDRGWTGSDCDQQCPRGRYGIGCASTCQCASSASCNPVDGSCTCAPGMQGKFCNHTCHGYFGHGCLARCPPCESQNVLVPKDCDPNNGKCQCKPGWVGLLCQDSCRIGWWGEGCQKQCLCKSGGICDHVTGNCSCVPGKTGILCGSDCPDGWYGENCPFECQCARKQQCARDTGACTCLPGWKDELCTERCDTNTWGLNCDNKCNCQNGECDPVFGKCSCDYGFMGDDCSTPCNSTTWGPNCQYTCNCDNHETCHPTKGTCECPVGWIGDSCENSCPEGYFGRGCQSVCKCVNGDCDHVSGTCNCTLGYYGDTCQNKCPNNRFGHNCAVNCSCPGGQHCHPDTGECFTPSIISDQEAQQAIDEGLNSSDVAVIAGSVAAGTVMIVLMVLVFLYCKHKVDSDSSLSVAYTAQGGVVSFSPMGNLEKEGGVQDGFDNPMYDSFKNDMYSDPVQENPMYGSTDDALQEAIVADAE